MFLLTVEGLGLFLATGLGVSSFSLVSRVKVMVDPTWRERVKATPLATSAWQMSRHWEAMMGSAPLTAAILFYF